MAQVGIKSGLAVLPVTECDLGREGVLDAPQSPEKMGGQRVVFGFPQQMLFAVSWVHFALLAPLAQVFANECPLLLVARIVGLIGIEMRIVGVRVVEGPFTEMIGQIEATITVRAVLKINEHDAIVG